MDSSSLYKVTNVKNSDVGDQHSLIKELTPNDFDPERPYRLKNIKGKCLVIFYAPWCGYCQKSKEVMEKVARQLPYFNIYAFNCERYKDHVQKIKDVGSNIVKSYPSLIFYNKGNPIESFQKERNFENLTRAIMGITER
jgi:thiol-disulfide isomerase/thioredoxin